VKEGSATFHTYRFYIGGTQETEVEPIIVTEEAKNAMNADLARFGLTGRWKRKVDVEYAKQVLSE
jgi:hypothetical protein